MRGMDEQARARVQRVRERLAEQDPDVLAAVEEVDRDLLAWSRSLAPMERLRACNRATRGLGRLRRASSSGS